MSQGDRKCIVCQKAYKFCGNCANDEHKDETWRNIFCSDNCQRIFNVLSMQGNGHIDDSKAKDMLSNLDLSRLKEFREDFRKQIESFDKAQVQPKVEDKKPEAPKFQKPFQSKEIVKNDSKK